MLGRMKSEGRGQWRKRLFDGVTDSMDMSLSKFWEMVKDRETGQCAVFGVIKSQTQLSNWTESLPLAMVISCSLGFFFFFFQYHFSLASSVIPYLNIHQNPAVNSLIYNVLQRIWIVRISIWCNCAWYFESHDNIHFNYIVTLFTFVIISVRLYSLSKYNFHLIYSELLDVESAQ